MLGDPTMYAIVISSCKYLKLRRIYHMTVVFGENPKRFVNEIVCVFTRYWRPLRQVRVSREVKI